MFRTCYLHDANILSDARMTCLVQVRWQGKYVRVQLFKSADTCAVLEQLAPASPITSFSRFNYKLAKGSAN